MTASAPPLPTITVRKDSPLCGDVIDLSVAAGSAVESASFRSRACSLTVASARVLTALVPGTSVADARELAARVEDAVRGAGALPPGCEPLEPALLLPSRRSCVLLPWRALVEALDTLELSVSERRAEGPM